MATRTVQCPICAEDMKDPRLLPCIHSFCLGCLQRYCRDKLPGDDVSCPVCRSEFQIPKNGVAGLPSRTHAQEPFNASEQSTRSHCEKHENERVTYCFNCSMNVCAVCCDDDHKTHNYERIETAVKQFSRSIDDNIKEITSRIESFRGVAAQLEAENYKALDNIELTELEVKKRSEEIKELVDRQENELLQELQSLRSAAEKDIKLQTDTLQLALSEMDSFMTTMLELRSKGSPSDITQTGNVHERAKELLETYVIPSEYHAPSYKFTPVNIDELLIFEQNIIGHVVQVVHSGTSCVVIELFLAADCIRYIIYSSLFTIAVARKHNNCTEKNRTT